MFNLIIMSQDIEKLAVFDSRIVQSRPKYAVEKGALSVTNAPFSSISATQSSHTYSINVPSENVFVDRAIEWSSTVYMQTTATLGITPMAGTPIAQYGRDWALCAFPLNSLCSTLQATINDTTSTINSQDVLKEILRLTDYKKNRLQRTCPTMLDKYQSYNDCAGAVNNPLSGYDSQTDYSEAPNGAWSNVIFTDTLGNPLSSTAVQANAQSAPAFPGANYIAVNGQPCIPYLWDPAPAYPALSLVYYNGSIWQVLAGQTPIPGTAPVAGTVWTLLVAGAGTPFKIYFRWSSTEKLVLSPFIFADCHEWDTGLFGINNIQLVMNLQAPDRIVRSTSKFNCSLTEPVYNPTSSNGAFINSKINLQFLTPSLDVPLPPKSVVPYLEFPKFITQFNGGTIPAGETAQIQSQSITINQIPDLLIIYVKPNVSTLTPSQGDWYLPVASSADSVTAPLSINFDNFAGLLSSHTTEQLYAMSIKNGLDMDYNTWIGSAHVGGAGAVGTLGGSSQKYGGMAAGRVPLVGGMLVLKPSQDIVLQTGQAPSLVGSFTLQVNLTVKNTSNVPQPGVQMYIVTVNSGFFETIRGSSRIIKGVLSEQDVIQAPIAPQGTSDMLSRYVGAGLFSTVANALSKAKDIYQASKPVVSAVKGLLPEGSAREVLDQVGYGNTGAGVGAGTGGRRKASSRCK